MNEGKSNRARINQSPTRRPREILGILQTVLFAPEDLSLVRGDPGDRRRYLDELLTSRIPRMAAVRADYDQVLRQRSALLKTAGGALRRISRGGGRPSEDGASALATLEVWDGHLAAHGAQLLAGRLRPRPRSGSAPGGVVPVAGTGVAARVHPLPLAVSARRCLRNSPNRHGFPEASDIAFLEERFLHELSVMRSKEIERGVCLVGPHRDDLELQLGDTPAKGFASHGESWSFALSLRLAGFALLRSDGSDPVLMLDDVFAELDRRRRRALAKVALDAEQVLITAAVPEDVPEELDAVRFGVEARDTDRGRISRIVEETEDRRDG